MDPSLKNCKKIKNRIINLKYFSLESENSLLHVKKITAFPTVSFLFYRLKMESFLYSLNCRQMRKKIAKWAGKSWSAENVREWCPEYHISTTYNGRIFNYSTQNLLKIGINISQFILKFFSAHRIFKYFLNIPLKFFF